MLRTAVVLPVVIVASAGCSSKSAEQVIPKQTVEQGIADVLEQKVGDRPDAVTCPGPVKPEAGTTIRCELTAVGLRYGVTATITSYTNGKGNYSVKVDSQPLGKSG
jgi:Domain of unknown function (DUF4333)